MKSMVQRSSMKYEMFRYRTPTISWRRGNNLREEWRRRSGSGRVMSQIRVRRVDAASCSVSRLILRVWTICRKMSRRETSRCKQGSRNRPWQELVLPLDHRLRSSFALRLRMRENISTIHINQRCNVVHFCKSHVGRSRNSKHVETFCARFRNCEIERECAVA